MKKKNGCIYKRGSIWWIKYYQRGKAIFESSKSNEHRIAEKLLLRREIEAEQDKLPNFQAERTKWDELAEDYLQDYKVNGRKSYRKAKEVVWHLGKDFSGVKAHDIKIKHIVEYVRRRQDEEVIRHGQQKKVSIATINRELSALKRMFNLGIENEKVLHMPKIKRYAENNIRRGFFEHDEFQALRAVLPDYLKPVVTMAYYTGMRKQEILGMRWDQVDLTEGVIRLEDTKNGEPREIYLNDEVFRMMVAQKRDRDMRFPSNPFCFYTPEGDPIGEFRKTWDTACKKVDLTGKIFHDFRRTAVRNMVRSGVPERVAMSISGHKTRSIFDRYNIVSTKDLRLAAKRVDVYLQAKAEAENPYRELEELGAVATPVRRLDE